MRIPRERQRHIARHSVKILYNLGCGPVACRSQFALSTCKDCWNDRPIAVDSAAAGDEEPGATGPNLDRLGNYAWG